MAGSSFDRLKMRLRIGSISLAAASVLVAPANAQLAPYAVESGAIAAPLDGLTGDPARGRAVVASRQKGLCLLCHSGPLPEERFQGDLAPSLAGAGARSTESELRLRMADSRRINPASIMPAYHAAGGASRVGQAFAGRPILTAQEIEDVVAYLKDLKD
jgi:L-cysteine S-thiosulfotransferase